MFRYFARLLEEHDLPVYPVALFSFDEPQREEEAAYRVEFPGWTVLDFSFRAIQLNRLNWRDYLRTPNPVASALMAKMSIAPEDRPRVKLECLRMLVTLKLDKARAALIGTFMDSYLQLTTAENLVYNRALGEIEPKEQESVVEYTNKWLREGMQKGLLQGREQGLEQGRQTGTRQATVDLILRQLQRRFGALPLELTECIGQMPKTRLDELFDALLDFCNVTDVEVWVGTHA